MSTEKTSAIKRLPKKLWNLGKLMMRLARVSHAYIRTAHSYKMKIAALEQERDKKLDGIRESQQELVQSIFNFADERKDEIIKDGNKSVTHATGQIGWREMAPSVAFEEGHSEKTVIAYLQKHKLKYLRSIPKINKEKILQDFRDGLFKKIRGLKIKQGQEFFISLAPRGKQKPETITIEVTP